MFLIIVRLVLTCGVIYSSRVYHVQEHDELHERHVKVREADVYVAVPQILIFEGIMLYMIFKIAFRLNKHSHLTFPSTISFITVFRL